MSKYAFYVFIFFFVFSILSVLLCIVQYCINNYKKHKHALIKDFLVNNLTDIKNKSLKSLIKKNKNCFMEEYISLLQQSVLSYRIRRRIMFYIHSLGLDKKYRKQIKSIFAKKRISSAVFLGYLPTIYNKKALEKSLIIEKNELVKIYILHSLLLMKSEDSLSVMVNSLDGCSSWYEEKAHKMLVEHSWNLYNYLKDFFCSEQTHIQKLIVNLGEIYFNQEIKEYLISKLDSKDKLIVYDAFKAITKNFPEYLMQDKYFYNDDLEIQKLTIIASTKVFNEEEILNKLLSLPKKEGLLKVLLFAVSEILNEKPELLEYLVNISQKEDTFSCQEILCNIFSSKVEYFILKYYLTKKDTYKAVIEKLIISNKISGILVFLDDNKDVELENFVLKIIQDMINLDSAIKDNIVPYLKDKYLAKLNIDKSVLEESKRLHPQIEGKIKILLYSLIFSFMLFPLVYIIRYFTSFNLYSPAKHILLFVSNSNYFLVFYFLILNSSYLILLFFAFFGLRQQLYLWNTKKLSFLFQNKLLPSISIIVSAFNEEKIIIESIYSLLNLSYPNYEVVVVNDGSKDNTLKKVVQTFDLKKVDVFIDNQLPTQPIRGIYKNSNFPKLIIIDKANGGKADSLNAGINFSENDYFCCIDSDSLLAKDALLKVAAQVLDSKKETVACGGNIFPINGCTVDKGVIVDVSLPKSPFAIFQSIEYLRAYMAGRLGWSYINSLLIISGAFGLFKKDRVVETGGYLAEKGKYHKDTVGEDMEIVVRLARYMSEKNIEYRIAYAFNANCWTEVPEDIKVLYRQRNRWQRGLVEIISFHKKLLFNYKYKRLGLLGLPYFFIFEVVGPIIEMLGYLMVVAAAILGLLSFDVVVLLFVASVLMGILVSISALYISLFQYPYIKLKDLSKIIFYNIIDNFGFRQLTSFWRVLAMKDSLLNISSWGNMNRKGFKK
jgi:peptidoglycan-N-acetylglucosamine deacetylase